MREKSIRLTTDEVKATLDGRKTQKRMIIKPQPIFESGYDSPHENELGIYWKREESYSSVEEFIKECHYQVGEVIYVKETWSTIDDLPYDNYVYRTDYGTNEDNSFPPSMFKWHPSIHMPREAARIFLRVVGVRVERLQGITEDDVQREGIEPRFKVRDQFSCDIAQQRFSELWDDLYDKCGYGWKVNPWVWVVEFERVEGLE